MKKGKEYELLIQKLYQQLEPNATVTHDDQIYDNAGKLLRQIDVSIRHRVANVDILIVVQAKDYKHKADIQVVDAFISVVNDVNASKGILVCSAGFSKAALAKAKHYGIECLSVHSALNKNWDILLKLKIHRSFHEFHLYDDILIDVAHLAGSKTLIDYDTFSYDGKNVITLADIIDFEILNKHTWKELKKSDGIWLDLTKKGINYIVNEDTCQIQQGLIKVIYKSSCYTKFCIEPTDYLYEKNHSSEESYTHSVTIKSDDLEKLATSNFVNDLSIDGQPDIKITIFKFGEHLICKFIFTHIGRIEGELIYKGNKLMKADKRADRIISLEKLFHAKQR